MLSADSHPSHPWTHLSACASFMLTPTLSPNKAGYQITTALLSRMRSRQKYNLSTALVLARCLIEKNAFPVLSVFFNLISFHALELLLFEILWFNVYKVQSVHP